MSRRPRLFFDLDRTLFRTAALDQLWQEIAQLFPEAALPRNYEDWDAYKRYNPDGSGLYYFDMNAYLTAMQLDPAEVYSQLRVSQLADGRFEFAGTSDLISSLEGHAEVAILTYGQEEYQRFKAALCPSLADIPLYITQEQKGRWLAQQGPCWLIDDKPLGDQLPPNVSFIQVSLEGRPISGSTPWPHFCTLGEVGVYLRAELNEPTTLHT